MDTCTKCSLPAAPRSKLCEAHRDARRRRQVYTMSRLRKKRRRLRACIHCGRAALSGTCPRCRVRRDRATVEAARVRGVTEGVTKASRTTVDSTVGNEGRTRYHGQTRRGRLSQADEDDKDRRDILDEIRRWDEGMALVRSPAYAEIGRVALRSAKDEALSRLGLARRLIDDVLERHRYRVPGTVD